MAKTARIMPETPKILINALGTQIATIADGKIVISAEGTLPIVRFHSSKRAIPTPIIEVSKANNEIIQNMFLR